MELYKKSTLIKEWNTHFLVLIPKTHNAKGLKDYRSIRLCNVIYKIITKIMVERIKHLLLNLISSKQDALIHKRNIIDEIILMH